MNPIQPKIDVQCQPTAYKEGMWDQIEEICKKEFESLRSFSWSNFIEANAAEIGIGVLVGVVSFLSLGQFGAILTMLGGSVEGGSVGSINTAIQLAQMPTTLLVGVVKVAFFAFFALVVPYIEEFAFREILHDLLGTDVGNRVEKGLKVLGNAFLFALYHVPAMVPHVSIILLLEVLILGIVLATLRVVTEGRVASTAAHITYNSLIFGTMFALA